MWHKNSGAVRVLVAVFSDYATVPDQHTHCTGVFMPHSLYATDTDLTADNLLRLPAEFGLITPQCLTNKKYRFIATLCKNDMVTAEPQGDRMRERFRYGAN
jgi:hypothetical protein